MKRPDWMNPVDQWFGPKRIGWGMGPRTWEGWVVMLVFAVVAVVAPPLLFGARHHPDPAMLDALAPKRS